MDAGRRDDRARRAAAARRVRRRRRLAHAPPPGPADDGAPPLLVAHDWGDAAAARADARSTRRWTRSRARRSTRVAIDLDLKIAGREDEVIAALREREPARAGDDLDDGGLEPRGARASSIPASSRGWTLPKVTRDWNSMPWARPLVAGALISLRARLPGVVRRRAPELGVSAIWAYHPVVTRAWWTPATTQGLELIAWTVDELPRMRALARARRRRDLHQRSAPVRRI